MVQKIIGIG